jgi:hypothetical protein
MPIGTPAGTPVGRHCVLMLKDGRSVIDWGNDLYQDLVTGDFLPRSEAEVSYTALDDDLEALKRAGVVSQFDAGQVFVIGLPEPPLSLMD